MTDEFDPRDYLARYGDCRCDGEYALTVRPGAVAHTVGYSLAELVAMFAAMSGLEYCVIAVHQPEGLRELQYGDVLRLMHQLG